MVAGATLLITADASQAEAELAKFQAQWNAAMKTITTGVADTAKRVALAAGVAFAGQAAVAGLAYMAVAQYDVALRQAAVIGDLTEAEMWKLNDAINASAAAWGVDGTQIANGVLMLAKAGLRGQEIIDVMDTITQAVLANGVSWDAAARAYVVAQTTFAKEGLSAIRIFDEFQAAANLSIIDVEDFATTFGYAASMMQVGGGTMEELLAVMALLTNAGSQAGIASRGFNQLLTTWVASAPAIQAWADSLGLGVQVIKDGKLNLNELIAAFVKMGYTTRFTIDDFQVLYTTMERNAARAFGRLLLNGDQYASMLEAITSSSGALSTVATATAKSLQSEWQMIVQTLMEVLRNKDVIESVSSAFTVLKQVIGENADALRDIVVTIIRDFAGNLPGMLDALRGLLQLVQALLPVMNAFAGTFVALVRVFAALPAPLQSTVVLLALAGKILPVSQFVAMGRAVYALYEQFDLLRIAMSLDPLGAMAVKAALLQNGLVGVAAAAIGVGTAILAMNADTTEARALWSAATGAAWGLTAAEFALMAINAGVWNAGVGSAVAVGLGAAALAAAGTFIAAQAAKSYAFGTPFVEETGPAFLHRGERVLTAAQNEELTTLLAGASWDRCRTQPTAVKAGPTYHGGMHGTLIQNFYDATREDIRYALARFGL